MSQSESATSSAAATTSQPVVLSQGEITIIESLVEANVQRSLDSLDAWKLTAPFRGDQTTTETKAARCSREKHTCDLEAADVSSLCVGCVLYRRIVRERSLFPVGGRTDVCDYMAMGIAEPLIFAFIKNGEWLNPTSELTGQWFVKHPITFVARPQTSMVPATQVAVRRNKVRLFRGDDILRRLGLSASSEVIFKRLHDYWHTEAGGSIYSLDELMDLLGPFVAIANNATRMGLVLDEVPEPFKISAGVQHLFAETAK